MSHKKDQRILKSEKAIIEAGISTLLANPSAGMSEIAEMAGVGRATLYRHFESREALVRKLAIVCNEEIDDAIKPYEHLKGRALIEAIIDVTVPMANRFRFLVSLWSLVEEDEVIRHINKQVQRDLYMLIEQAKKAGEIDKGLPTAWVVAFFDSTLDAAWILENDDISTKDVAELVKKSFFRGCGNDR